MVSVFFPSFWFPCSSTSTWSFTKEFFCREGKPSSKETLLADSMLESIKSEGRLQLFTLEKLATAKNHFHESHKPWRGDFGPVYKVLIVPIILFGFWEK